MWQFENWNLIEITMKYAYLSLVFAFISSIIFTITFILFKRFSLIHPSLLNQPLLLLLITLAVINADLSLPELRA